MSADESVCVGCGLCCDGTVVTHLAVADESDLGAPLRSLGVEVIVAADPPVFALPCPAVAGGECTVYGLHRPRACAQFECSVSRSVLAGSLAPDDARTTIASARGLVEAVRGGAAVDSELQEFLDRHFRWWATTPDRRSQGPAGTG